MPELNSKEWAETARTEVFRPRARPLFITIL